MKNQEDVKHWPSGNCKEVLLLDIAPEELTSRCEVSLNRDKDDLDWYVGGYIIDDAIGPIVFIRYDNAPIKGVIVEIDVGIETAVALSRLKHVLHLQDAEIIWSVDLE